MLFVLFQALLLIAIRQANPLKKPEIKITFLRILNPKAPQKKNLFFSILIRATSDLPAVGRQARGQLSTNDGGTSSTLRPVTYVFLFSNYGTVVSL
jgi:hypothetical protein